jgi:hypothetical protein
MRDLKGDARKESYGAVLANQRAQKKLGEACGRIAERKQDHL